MFQECRNLRKLAFTDFIGTSFRQLTGGIVT